MCSLWTFLSIFKPLFLRDFRLDFFVKLSIENFKLLKKSRYKNWLDFSSRQNPDTSKSPESVFTFDLFRYSYACFSVTAVLISSTKVAMEIFLICKEFSSWKLWSPFLALVTHSSAYLDYATDHFKNYSFEFPHQGLIWRCYTVKGVSNLNFLTVFFRFDCW